MISSNLINRLAEDDEKLKKRTKKTKPRVPREPRQPQTKLDAIRAVVKESENVVEKLRKQEDNMVQEVTQRAKDLHEKEFKIPEQKPMPCLVENNACMECFKENVKDVTKCAPLAQNYADCARRVRQLVKSSGK
ncbi:hypothetical protein V6Z11_A03G018600 [Gossypium hirsutum]